ncbi:hypothetical protein OKA04_17325 [Luteolibacter flavescens]|uniref:Uncharacterized protein n=1 Tax=Luteolibacter flavescens TaxID=1859460 RepID=A0ABT3FSF9_9BACT|nr:hypothetical protein [Luteolibacter flavescens]MCW1886503.1 hypothetical protein [Luteolibacter flavescens]
MIRPLVIAALFAAPLAAEEAVPATDLLRFTNGNQIDGRFSGMDSGGVITWTRPDVATPMPFQRDKVRQVVLRNAHPLSAMSDPCHVTLVNGDRFPGKVVAADDKTVTIDTTSAGTMVLPRDAVAVISPNPFGGRLLYAGPFDEKGWNVVHLDGPAAEPDPFAGNLRAPLTPKADEEEAGKPSWVHTGASWYSKGGATDAITLDANLPDQALLRFKLGWRSRPSLSVAFHADLETPAPKDKKDGEEEEQPRLNFGGMQQLARLFGTSYVINFQSGYPYLQRTWFNDEGQPQTERVRNGTTSVRLPDTGEAIFEIRCDRKHGTITVHVDGEFVVQWNVSEDAGRIAGEAKAEGQGSYQAPGGGIGFMVPGTSAAVRVSDIILAEWNGMTDSARSMESDHRDIALLSNGTDRFSGQVIAIRNGVMEIDASYGPLKVPMNEVAEIHFARDQRRKVEEAASSEIAVHLQPVGRVSGVPLASANGRIQLESTLAGKIDLDLSPAVILEFQTGGGFLDDWDDEP